MEIIMWMIYSAAGLALGAVLDRIFGDPHWRFHPICLIGKLISAAERVIRNIFPKSMGGELAGGAVMAVIVCLIVTAAAAAAGIAAYLISPYVYIAAEGIMCWFVVAAQSLKKESMKVCHALEQGNTEKAREAVSMIVGRDTAALDQEGMIKAAVETVAENTSDGVIAPLIFTAIGGAPLGYLYKSVNTMDSMVGYKNEKYIYFGRAAAKLDDAVNFIPARISGLLTVLAAYMIGLDGRNAFRIFKRDRLKHASPNSAHTESACAGAMGVRLAGDAYYFGKLYKKQYIGDDTRSVVTDDIRCANRLMYASSSVMLAVLLAAKAAVWFIFI